MLSQHQRRKKNEQTKFLFEKNRGKLQQNYANLCAHPVKGSNNINSSSNEHNEKIKYLQ